MTGTTLEVKKTPAELAQEELAAQAQDRVDAQAEIDAREDFVPPEPFVVLEKYFAGAIPGPLAYETHRGLLKVFPGDVKAVVEYPIVDAEGNPILDADGNPTMGRDQFVVCSEAFRAMFEAIDIPMGLEELTIQKGIERRKAAAEPPAEPPPNP